MNSLHIAKFLNHRIRKIRDAIPSVPGLLEDLHKNPNNTALSKCVCVCACVCICVYLCVHVHVCVYLCVATCISSYLCMCVCPRVNACVYASAYEHEYVCTHFGGNVAIHFYLHVYM